MLPQDVDVSGYYRADGTFVRPHTRHIDGIKDEEDSGPGRRVRSAYRSTARGLPDSAIRYRQYPVREWRSINGEAIGKGRLKWRANDTIHLELEDGRGINMLVEEVSNDDQEWLVTAEKEPDQVETSSDDSGEPRAATGQSQVDSGDRVREWKNDDGEVVAVGRFLSQLGETVWLKTREGKRLKLDAYDLSDADREYLEESARR